MAKELDKKEENMQMTVCKNCKGKMPGPPLVRASQSKPETPEYEKEGFCSEGCYLVDLRGKYTEKRKLYYSFKAGEHWLSPFEERQLVAQLDLLSNKINKLEGK